MSKNLPLTGPVGLEALDRFLMSDASPEDCMQLSELDGFLTGIAIGPELVMPSEWLPAIWGGEEPVFEDDEQARTVIGMIMGRTTRSCACSTPTGKPMNRCSGKV